MEQVRAVWGLGLMQVQKKPLLRMFCRDASSPARYLGHEVLKPSDKKT